jgi:catalase
MSDGGRALMEMAGLGEQLDAGCVPLDGPDSVGAFLKAASALRLWERELTA